MIKKYKKLVIITLVLGLLLGVFVGCSQNEATSNSQQSSNQSENNKPSIPVEVAKADTGKISKSITVTGEAKPAKSVNVTPQLQAQVEKVGVEVGDKVKAGNDLLQLDQEDVKVQFEKAEAGLEVAKANLNQILAGTRDDEISQIKAELKRAKANYDQAKKDYHRQQKLFKKDVISEQQLEASESKYISAKSTYKSTKLKLKIAKDGATEEKIQVLKAQVNQAKKNLKTAQVKLDKTEVTAPISGIVTQVDIETGEMAASQPAVSIVDLTPIKLKTFVSEQNINDLEKGQSVEVDFNALDNKLQGKIKKISPKMNQQHSGFLVEITINNSKRLIKAGMYAKATIETESSAGELVIPKQSLLQENNKNYVFIVQNNQAVRKEVTIGLTNSKKVEVLSGINLGDKIITVGSQKVSAGNEVRVVGGGGQ
ncbi:efflux RND transporter periplasmic adaptor subunit [Halanaerobaculum tunisiense]